MDESLLFKPASTSERSACEKIPDLAYAAGRSDLAFHIRVGRLYNPRFNALYTGGAEGLDELLKLAATAK